MSKKTLCPYCGAEEFAHLAPKRFFLPSILAVLGFWGLFHLEWGRTEIFAEIGCFCLAALGFWAAFAFPYTCRKCKKPFRG